MKRLVTVNRIGSRIKSRNYWIHLLLFLEPLRFEIEVQEVREDDTRDDKGYQVMKEVGI